MPPPGYEPFLSAICAEPEDDTVRLVYADWLDENGDPERAEFVRLQVAMPERPRAYDPQYARAEALRVRNWEAWFGELPKLSGIHWTGQFWRGFVSGVCAERGKRLCLQREHVFGATPVQFLTLNDAGRGTLEQVLQLSEVGHLLGLTLQHCRLTSGHWDVLTACPRLGRLKGLRVDGGQFRVTERVPALSESDARAFVNSTCLPRLESLTINGYVDPPALALLRTRFAVGTF